MIVLKAKDGHWLFDGETFVKVISLANSADMEKWQEITDEYKEQWEREHAPAVPEPENEQ